MFTQGGLFLIKTVFNLYIMLLMMRVLLQYFHANYFNPVSQFVVKLTDPAVKFLKPYIPGFKGIDLGVVVAIFSVAFVKIILMLLIAFGSIISVPGLIVISIADVFSQFTSLLFYLVLGRVLLSWIQSPQTGPIQEICYTITEPLLAPVRRLIPPVSGFDLSPIVLLLLIQLVNVVLLRGSSSF